MISVLQAATLASTALLGPMLGVALYNLATARRLERAAPSPRPRVSVLVPARDELENLRANLPLLLEQSHRDLEIVVLDDRSADGTPEVVRGLAAADSRLRLVRGAVLPPGWVGKNWACHQLAAAARGEVVIFCDADVSAGPDAVLYTLRWLARADVVTALPWQRLGGWMERALVPLVAQLPVLMLLPLRGVEASPSPALSMANGQWLAFRRDAYSRVGGHAAVRGEVLEDVALGRRVKSHGLRLLPVVASRELGIRMYATPGEVWAGFRKNLYPLLGGHPTALVVAVAVILLTGVYPLAAPLLGGGWLPLALLAGVRGAGAVLFRHDARTVLLHPIGALLMAALALDSALGHRRGTVRWKGRRLEHGASGAALPNPLLSREG